MHFANIKESQHIFDNVRLALKRLDTEYIDVLQVHMARSGESGHPLTTASQLHRFDYETPVHKGSPMNLGLRY